MRAAITCFTWTTAAQLKIEVRKPLSANLAMIQMHSEDQHENGISSATPAMHGGQTVIGRRVKEMLGHSRDRPSGTIAYLLAQRIRLLAVASLAHSRRFPRVQHARNPAVLPHLFAMSYLAPSDLRGKPFRRNSVHSRANIIL